MAGSLRAAAVERDGIGRLPPQAEARRRCTLATPSLTPCSYGNQQIPFSSAPSGTAAPRRSDGWWSVSFGPECALSPRFAVGTA